MRKNKNPRTQNTCTHAYASCSHATAQRHGGKRHVKRSELCFVCGMECRKTHTCRPHTSPTASTTAFLKITATPGLTCFNCLPAAQACSPACGEPRLCQLFNQYISQSTVSQRKKLHDYKFTTWIFRRSSEISVVDPKYEFMFQQLGSDSPRSNVLGSAGTRIL